MPRGIPASLLLAVVPALIMCGLAVDQFGGPQGQWIVVVTTWLVFGWLLARTDGAGRTMMLCCLAYASIGEVLLSLVWRVYDYRMGNLPLFVPPGHVLLFLLGLAVAPRVSARVVRQVAIAAMLIVAVLAITRRDTFSVVLVAVFVGSVVYGRDRQLYATMFVLALAMELYGTWLGNWRWGVHVGVTGLITTNPPIAAGAFYCALDLLVMYTMRVIGRGVKQTSVAAGARPTRVSPSA